VGEIRVRQGLRQQEIARDVGLPPHALSEYLNCRAHPSEERQEVLTKLGCDLGRVRRAILADKLAYWMAKLDLDAEDLITAARQVHDEAVRPDRFSEVRLIGQAADR
jgi:transcriptional regulator with XRE-family HTH domain